MASQNTQNPSDDNTQDNNRSRHRINVLQSNPSVDIADLQPRNNNSSFVGKIVELEVISKPSKKSDKLRSFLKGYVADSTGKVRFDMAQKEGTQLKKGDIVRFDKAMNKVDKEHHHYVEVKRLGTYEILADHEDIVVNVSVNKSEAVIPELPEGERPVRLEKPSQNKQSANKQQRPRPAKKAPFQPIQNNQNKHQVFQKTTQVNELTPSTQGQILLGQVVEVESYSKTNSKEVTQLYHKGRFGDESGTINFDFKSQKNHEISKNDIVQLSNVMNKVDESGIHYITIGRYGFYTIFSATKVNGNQGTLGDAAGTIAFTAEKGLVQGKVYKIQGSLKIVNYNLLIVVESASDSDSTIETIGNTNFSAQQFDPSSSKPIVQIKALLQGRIGQSFFAKITDLKRDEESLTIVFGDSTAQVEAQIEVGAKTGVSKEILDNLEVKKVYIVSDMILRFNEENQLIGKFNLFSNVSEASEQNIPSIGKLNISEHKYEDEEKNEISETLCIGEKPKVIQDKSYRNQHQKYQNNYSGHQSFKPNFNNYNNSSNNNRYNNQSNNNNNYSNNNTHNNSSIAPLTIDQLQAWNNNQSFIGKILSVEVVNSGEPKNINYLKGQVGDSTGVIDFDLAQKHGVSLQVGDIVRFDKAMNKVKDGRHFIDVKRYGSYHVIQNHKISTINQSNDLSQKEVPPRPEIIENVNPPKEESNDPVQINELALGNNKQIFFGKVISVSQEERKSKYNNSVLTHLVGTVADETGLVQFDVVKQENSGLKVNDIVRFENAINTQSEGNHLVKIIHLGKYEVVDDVQIKKVSTQAIVVDVQENPSHLNSSNKNYGHKTHHNNNYNDGNHKSKYEENKRPDNRQFKNNSYENKSFNKPSNQKYEEGQRRHQNNTEERTNYHDEYTKIKDLKAGEKGQNVIGKVIELNKVNKEINGRNLTFVKGVIADETANIRYDFSQNEPLEEGLIYRFKNIMNSVDKNGYHYVTLGKYGTYHISRKINMPNVNLGEGEADNLSSFAYVKKTVSDRR